MGDWYQVHHCVLCPDHQTALRIYERIECAGEKLTRGGRGPTGIRWGFFSPTLVLLTTTSKWGSHPGFIAPIVEGLTSVDCLTSDDSDADRDDDEQDEAKHATSEVSSFEHALRERLGATRDFLWSDKGPVMSALLEALTPHATDLTTLALLPDGRGRSVGPRSVKLPPAADEALAPFRYSSVVHGFLTANGACFGIASFDAGEPTRFESPLWTPLAAVRQCGPGAWAIHQILDGNEPLPVHLSPSVDLWRLERHGGHGAWQPRAQRLAIARAALSSGVAEDRQAGSALARRWWLTELAGELSALRRDDSEHVVASADLALRTLAPATQVTVTGPTDDSPDEDTAATRARLRASADGHPEEATRVMSWIGLARTGDASDVARALELMGDESLGGAARWVVGSRGDPEAHDVVERLVNACVELAEIARPFIDRAWEDDALGRVFSARLGELAYASTRTSYWMVRYGVAGADGPPTAAAIDDRDAWRGAIGARADRISFWAARTLDATDDSLPRRALLRAFVAFNELLSACRANRVFWLPPVGVIHAQLDALLEGRTPAPKAFDMPGNAELSLLRSRATALGEIYRRIAHSPDRHPEFEEMSVLALSAVPSPLEICCYSQYGRAAHPLVCWVANNLAWRLFERGAFAEALIYADRAVASAGWDDDAARDTRARVLLALGQDDEGYEVIRCALARTPGSEPLRDLAASAGYRAWTRAREAGPAQNVAPSS